MQLIFISLNINLTKKLIWGLFFFIHDSLSPTYLGVHQRGSRSRDVRHPSLDGLISLPVSVLLHSPLTCEQHPIRYT